MKSIFTPYNLIIVLIAGLLLCGIPQPAAYAGHSSLVDDMFTRISPDTPSGSGHTVREECGNNVDGFDNATATLEIEQDRGESRVIIKVNDAKPDIYYTVWLRLRGNSEDGSPINIDATGTCNGSPLTCGGATPLAPGSELVNLWHATPAYDGGVGSVTLANGFFTDSLGNATFIVTLDFPVIGGAYPFNLMPDGMIPNAREIPAAIVNPDAPGVNAPFLLRIVSHCQDNKGHGLSPSGSGGVGREAWFQWP